MQPQVISLIVNRTIKCAILGAIAAAIFGLEIGFVSTGIVAIPISLSALCGIWVYVKVKPTVRACLGLERDL